MPRSPSSIPTFHEKHRDLAKAAELLRGAMSEALSAVLVGERGIRSVGRRLGIDKMLASHALRIASAIDAPDVLSSLPGERGMKSLVEALRRADVSAAVMATLESAVVRWNLPTAGSA